MNCVHLPFPCFPPSPLSSAATAARVVCPLARLAALSIGHRPNWPTDQWPTSRIADGSNGRKLEWTKARMAEARMVASSNCRKFDRLNISSHRYDRNKFDHSRKKPGGSNSIVTGPIRVVDSLFLQNGIYNNFQCC